MLLEIVILVLFSLQGELDQMAQDHADALAGRDELYHSDIAPLFIQNGGPCEWVGEVIYRGGNPDDRWDAYAESPSHDQTVNIERTHHGVGIVQESGIYIVVDIFCREAITSTTTATPTTAITTPPPIVVLPVLTVKAPPLCPVPLQICVY